MNRSFLLSAVALFILAFSASSCTEDVLCVNGRGAVVERTLELASFDGIKVPGHANVYIQKGDSQSVRVRSQENILDAIDFTVSGDKLIIDLDGCYYSYDLDVYITLDRPLSEISVTGSADVTGDGTIPASPELSIDVSGSGSVNLDLDAANITSNITGSGDISLSGKAENHQLKISGSGDLQAFDLVTESTTLNMTGAASSEIRVEGGLLDVSISGSGTVYYKGNPGSVNTKITGSGRLIDSN